MTNQRKEKHDQIYCKEKLRTLKKQNWNGQRSEAKLEIKRRNKEEEKEEGER